MVTAISSCVLFCCLQTDNFWGSWSRSMRVWASEWWRRWKREVTLVRSVEITAWETTLGTSLIPMLGFIPLLLLVPLRLLSFRQNAASSLSSAHFCTLTSWISLLITSHWSYLLLISAFCSRLIADLLVKCFNVFFHLYFLLLHFCIHFGMLGSWWSLCVWFINHLWSSLFLLVVVPTAMNWLTGLLKELTKSTKKRGIG